MKLNGIDHVGVIGTGMIGTSLGVLLTGHGYRTTLLAVDETQIVESRKKFDSFYEAMVENQVMTQAQADVCKRYISFTTDYAMLKDVDYVFEAVVEQLPVKQEVYRRLEACSPKLRLIMSVSSAIQIGRASCRERV